MSTQSWNEERANAISHGLGAVLSAAGLVMLILQSLREGGLLHVCVAVVFGVSLLMAYVCSTLLHGSVNKPSFARFEMMDHAAIYVLIAGTYTPFLLLLRNETVGQAVLGAVWLLAAAGVLLQLMYPLRFMAFTLSLYTLMAWLVVPVIRPLQQLLPYEGMFWLLVGIALYSVGAIFYFWRKMRYHHTVWHLFVVGGSLCHFVSVYAYVLPLLS